MYGFFPSLSEKEEKERGEKIKRRREGLTPRLTATDPRSTRPFYRTGFAVKTQVTRYSIYRRNLSALEKLVPTFPGRIQNIACHTIHQPKQANTSVKGGTNGSK